ncbi:MAG: peptidoglycan DD-metalloendopeptidase family protein [Elusimicrobiota bacterium]|jgi:septal ring factor EnvC (AmiA/AmiB activator)|nr:peptidoglycan DD-metalloendopeptidase family protein [Elusimicrobiota bacterium]
MKHITVISALMFFFVCTGFGQGTDISAQERKLASVQQSIKQKEREKNQLAKDEANFKREVERLDKLISNADTKLKDIASQIKAAEVKVGVASEKYDTASRQSDILNETISDEVSVYYKMTISTDYWKDPVAYKIMQAGIEGKESNFENEKKKVAVSSQEILRWQKTKNELLTLGKKENAVNEERKRLIEEKNKLVKTTSNKRKQAEAEIRQLNASAKELQGVINNLIAESKKRRELEEQKERQRRAAEIKATQTISPKPTAAIYSPPKSTPSSSQTLIWPVNGVVVLPFGRNHHPDLDAFVVSNGIKIKAANRAEVKSAADGTVVFIGRISSYGRVVIIEHSAVFAVYGQLSEVSVKNGAKIKQGRPVGKLGTGDDSVLYFEIRKDDDPVNPILWLRK